MPLPGEATPLMPADAGGINGGMSSALPGPASHFYMSQRLKLHYVDWGNPDAPPLLLVHGGQDHCRNWDWVAQALRKDYHIIAPDLRGHGDSQWLIGGNYHQVDYAYDIAQLIHQAGLAPLRIIGHSLGGAISLRYTGLYPENVTKLIAIEGLGMPPEVVKKRTETPVETRTRDWIDTVRGYSARLPRRYASIEDATKRMQEANPHLNADQARHLTVHGINQNEDGTYSWKFDNYVRSRSPLPQETADVQRLWSRITCPTLLFRGTESWASDPLQDGRAAHFSDARVENIEGAGHWVHHDKLEQFLDLSRAFLAD